MRTSRRLFSGLLAVIVLIGSVVRGEPSAQLPTGHIETGQIPSAGDANNESREKKYHRFTIRVTDADGSPIQSAQVGQAATRDGSQRNSDWQFRGDVSSGQVRPLITNANGEAQMVLDVGREQTLIEHGFKQFPLVARHATKKLIGISQTSRAELLSWSTKQPAVAILLVPECRVHGRVESTDLGKLDRRLKSVTLAVMLDERCSVFVLASPRPDYELFLPPGEYQLMALGGRDVQVGFKSISVPTGTTELEIETLDLRSTK
jgi:hypothetical protein